MTPGCRPASRKTIFFLDKNEKQINHGLNKAFLELLFMISQINFIYTCKHLTFSVSVLIFWANISTACYARWRNCVFIEIKISVCSLMFTHVLCGIILCLNLEEK